MAKQTRKAGVSRNGMFLWAEEGGVKRCENRKWCQGKTYYKSMLEAIEGNTIIYEDDEVIKKQEETRDLDLEKFTESYND